MSRMTIDSEGTKRWRNARGELHRIDGPAFEWSNGTKMWYVNGRHHRLDGPAYEVFEGSMGWYIDGVRCFNFKDFQVAGRLTNDQMTILRLKYGEI